MEFTQKDELSNGLLIDGKNFEHRQVVHCEIDVEKFKIDVIMASETTTVRRGGPAKRQRVESVNNDERCRSEQHRGANTSTRAQKSVSLPVELEPSENEYRIENTVIVNVEGKLVEADDIIDSIEKLCGENTLIACVQCGRNTYEITMKNKESSDALIPTLRIGQTTVSVSSVSEKSTMVSILHLPTYISDIEIVEKIQSYNIQIVSPIQRRYRRIRKRKRRIADGTRFFRVKFPKEVKSLPWSLAFEVRGTSRYFRTIHDDQERVCFKCCSVDHLSRFCPLNMCYSCSENGHISWDCPKKRYQNKGIPINDCERGTESESEKESKSESENEIGRPGEQNEESKTDDTSKVRDEDENSDEVEMNCDDVEGKNNALSNNEDNELEQNEESNTGNSDKPSGLPNTKDDSVFGKKDGEEKINKNKTTPPMDMKVGLTMEEAEEVFRGHLKIYERTRKHVRNIPPETRQNFELKGKNKDQGKHKNTRKEHNDSDTGNEKNRHMRKDETTDGDIGDKGRTSNMDKSQETTISDNKPGQKKQERKKRIKIKPNLECERNKDEKH